MRKLSKDYKGRCGHCHAFIGQDEYCRYCGTKKGDGEFLPYNDEVQCVYGPPPIERIHKCENCGYKWSARMMIDDQRYCPKCGSRVKVTAANPEDEPYM